MHLRTVLREAIQSLNYYRRRSVITVMSLAWGVASFMILMTYGGGFESALVTAFRAVGPDVICTWNGQTSSQAGGMRAGRRIRMELDDATTLKNTIPAIGALSPELFIGGHKVMRGNVEKDYLLRGVWPEYQTVRNIKIAQGRWLNGLDNNQRNRVAVIGATVADELFKGYPPLGQEITVNGVRFEIIGVMEPKVQISNYNRPDNYCVFIPYETGGLFRNTRYPHMIVWMARTPDARADAIRQVRATLAAIHRFSPTDEKAVEILSFSQFMSIIDGMTMALQILLGFVGSLTLGIGGVGLTNIMLASVLERTREIGILRAVGSPKRTVLLQFLAEALLIVAIGGICGVALAWGGVTAISSLPFLGGIMRDLTEEHGRIEFHLSTASLLVSTGVLFAVGLVAGLIPAFRAANLDPVKALQYE